MTSTIPSLPRLAVGICGALGLFLGMANPLAHVPVLALLYPAVLAYLGLTAYSRGQAFKQGWFCGLAGASACLYWIAVPITQVAMQPLVIGISCVLLLSGYVGLYGGAFAFLAFYTRQAPLWLHIPALGVGWYLLEVFRGWFFTGFPWLPLTAAFVPWTSWIQPVSWIGAYALGGILAGLAALAALGIAKRRTRAILAALAGLALIPAVGVWQLTDPPSSEETLAVTLVQGNIDQNQKWDSRYLDTTIKTYKSLSLETEAALVIWPETAMPIDYLRHEKGRELRRFAAEKNIWLLFGAPGLELRQGTEELFNKAFLISPLGRNKGNYAKEHLVPFGEFVPPFLNLPFLQGLLQGIGDFTPGTSVEPLIMDPAEGRVSTRLALGILICYETIFPELSRHRVAQGADVLINISNDAWFGMSSAPVQHVHLSILRAVEQRRWLARGTNTGISAIVSPTGEVTVHGGLFIPETVSGSVRPVREKTVFFHLYPWLTPLGVFLFLALMLCIRRNKDLPTTV